MSAPMNNETEQASQGNSSWFTRKLSRKLSLANKDTTPKDTTTKETTTTEGGIGQQAMDKGEEIKKDLTSGNLDSVKDMASKGENMEDLPSKGENIKEATTKGDVAGAMGETGLNKESVNKKSIDDVGRRLFGSRVGSVSANHDIKKGPITDGYDQRDTGQELVGATGSGSGSGSAAAGSSAAAPGSGATALSTGAGLLGVTKSGTGASATKDSSAGGTWGDNSMDQELDNQAHISSDVFGDRNGLQNTSKDGSYGPTTAGIDEKLSERRKLSTGKMDKMKSKSAHQGAASQAAMGGAALGAAGGMGVGGVSQQASTNTMGQTSKGMTTQGRMSGVPGGGLTQAVGQKSDKAASKAAMAGAEGMAAGGMGAGALAAGGANRGMKSTTSRNVSNLSGTSYKVTILQDKVQAVSQKCKTQLGGSASEISLRSPTVDAFFDAVAAERLRWMPRDGSRLDCSLRWASRLAYAVDNLRESVGAFAPGANEAAKLIWGFEIMLLEVSNVTLNC